jgi:hypothetical protein
MSSWCANKTLHAQNAAQYFDIQRCSTHLARSVNYRWVHIAVALFVEDGTLSRDDVNGGHATHRHDCYEDEHERDLGGIVASAPEDSACG